MAKDSIGVLLVEAGILLLFVLCWKWSSWSFFWIPIGLVCILLMFTAYFFRDPHRTLPDGKGLILSPADGKIVEIADVRAASFVGFMKGPARRVAIFLSVWDVHINRIPVTGSVAYLQYQKGRFLPAYENEAGNRNEQMLVGIESKDGKVLMKQIAGILARRIVCRLKMNERVIQGDRFGMIKFGSRAELYFPSSVNVTVKVGDKVKAGQSIIGEFVHAK